MLLTTTQAADLLGMTRQQVAARARRGLLPGAQRNPKAAGAVSNRTSWRFDKRELLRYKREQIEARTERRAVRPELPQAPTAVDPLSALLVQTNVRLGRIEALLERVVDVWKA